MSTDQSELNAFLGNAEIHKYQILVFQQVEMHQMALRQNNLLRFVLKLVLNVDWLTSYSARRIPANQWLANQLRASLWKRAWIFKNWIVFKKSMFRLLIVDVMKEKLSSILIVEVRWSIQNWIVYVLTLIGEFPWPKLDRIKGKLIQRKFMSSYSVFSEIGSWTRLFYWKTHPKQSI